MYASWNEKHTEERHKEFKELDLVELNALIGVLILRGVFAGRNENIHNLWAKSVLIPVERQTELTSKG